MCIRDSIWTETHKLVASDATASALFGSAVAFDGNVALIGATGANANSGAVYVVGRNRGGPSNWGEVAKLTASDAAPGDRFGNTVTNTASPETHRPRRHRSAGRTCGTDRW